MKFHKALMDASLRLIQFSQAQHSTANVALVDALTCLFRFRYRNSTVIRADRSVPATLLAVKRRLLVLWCRGLINCCAVTDNQLENAFHAELAAYIADLISKMCENIGLEMDIPEVSSRNAEAGISVGVKEAAGAIENNVQQALDEEINALRACDPGYVEFIQHEVIMVLAAIRIGFYDNEIAAFSAKICKCTKAAIAKNDAQERMELAAAHDDFVKDMLGFVDGLRYEEKFQFVFCLWGPAPTNCATAQFE
jgi:hypothetical protein